jgi:hypothetical protein
MGGTTTGGITMGGSAGSSGTAGSSGGGGANGGTDIGGTAGSGGAGGNMGGSGSGGGGTGSGGGGSSGAGSGGGGSGGGGSGGGGSGGGGSGGGGSGGGGSGGGGSGGMGGMCCDGPDIVVTTGTDENTAGATQANPGGTGLSLREAINLANSTAGVQRIVMQGAIITAETSPMPIIAEGVTIVGAVVDASGSTNKDCFNIAAGPTVFDGMDLYGCKGRPIHVTAGNSIQIMNSHLHNNSGQIAVEAAVGSTSTIGPNNTIEGFTNNCVFIANTGALVVDNNVFNCGNAAVFLSATAVDTSVVGNLLHLSQNGVGMSMGTDQAKVWFNTIVQNTAAGIIIGSATNVDMRDNIIANNGSFGATAFAASFAAQDYNLFFGNGNTNCSACTPGVHSVLLDPQFTNAAGGDYTLKGTSPAINAGVDVGQDRNGASAGNYNGTAPDMGYWESP